MDGLLQPPSVTAFDAFAGVASAVLYLSVALATYAHAPRDIRARVFAIIALASVPPYLLPALLGRIGAGALFGIATAATAVSLAVGSLALFHFTQVFPQRRPWIRAHGIWLVAAYLVLPLAASIGAWALMPMLQNMSNPSTPADIGVLTPVVLLVVFIPAVFAAGIVLPFAGLLSLYKSWQEAKADGRGAARVTTLAMLISQLAGGVLTILIVPLLHLIGASGPLVTIASGLLFGFGLLMPVAFAIGVWTYRLLEPS